MEKLFVLDSVSGEPVFTQFRHNAKGAIKALMEAGGGVAVAALHHPEVGDIDLRWGGTTDNANNKGAGLAKLLKWHPEAIVDLQGFIEKMAVDKEGPGRVWLVKGDDVAILAKDWKGASGNWLLTAYTKKKANTASGTMDAACFASLDDTATQRSVGELIIGFECDAVNPALDDTGVPDVAAMMARMKLTSQLRGLKAQILALGKDPLSMIKSARLAEQLRKIRKELGASTGMTKPQVESPHVTTLRAVAAGQHDSKGLPELYGLIQEAANGLDEAGELTGEADAVANEAITHWGELEERLSAHV